MKISYNWLKTFINADIPVDVAGKLLTSSGLEVETIEPFEPVKGGFKGLVVGHVVECSTHPDADRLSLTKVDIGDGVVLSIVCGAPNVAAGQKVIVATVGTKLYPSEGEPFEIKKSKIRGAASEGMICAEDEIGIGKGHAGIMVLPQETKTGMQVADFFKIENDLVLEIGLTPNRSDAASHLGVARDLATIINCSNENDEIKVEIGGVTPLPQSDNSNEVEINIVNPEACKRYSGLVIKNIEVKESPAWLQNRLKAIGLRPINNIVDITNFVLHDLGQPLHAFDYDKIGGKQVRVRTANPGEKFVTLDGIERTLHEDDLMICDATSPMCIAGVFGGLESGVTEKTKTIFLESAYFEPSFIRKTSKRHGLKTDASFRFERGTDPEITVKALIKAANLIFDLAGGQMAMDVADVYPNKLEPYKVTFSYHNCNELIGKEIERKSVKNIFGNLGIDIETEGSDGLLLRVPRYKTDVTREVDLIEEVMRIYGYDRVEVSKSISYTAFNEPENFSAALENKCGTILEGFGFNEMMGLSLTKDAYYSDQINNVKVVNPLSNDLNILRRDMIYSGLEAIAFNINRKNSDLKLFEFGRTYSMNPDAEFKYAEQKHLTLFVSGNLFNENPYGLNQKADFSFLKSAVLNLFEKCGVKNIKSAESEYSNFEYGLNFSTNNKSIAEIGLVKTGLLKKFDIAQPVYYANFNWELMVKAFAKREVRYQEISKFPSVRRDLALLIDSSIKYMQIEELAYSVEKRLLKEVNLFDIYQSEKLGNKKSYAISFTLLNKEATLTDKIIDGVMEKLISAFKEKLGAELR